MAIVERAGTDVRHLFDMEGTWLNSATYGLPPRVAWEAFARAADEWRRGLCGFDGWDRSVGRARAAFARMHGVAAHEVAVGSQVSAFVGLIAASLPPGSRMLCPAEDFTSVLFPFMAQEARGVRTELVPLERLADAIDGRTTMVAFSAVQSADGRVADLDAIAAAARHHDVFTVCDTTQASGWMPIDARRWDATICAGYKWLLNPRGTAYMAIADRLLDHVTPHAAGWYAAADPCGALYGGPLRIAPTAKRFDASPAWLSWVGAAPALEFIEGIGLGRIHEHDVRLANLLRDGLGLPPSNTAIVSLDVDSAVHARLMEAGVGAAGRDGRLRLAFHLYNDESDVERALHHLQG
jgi:selenocysteine lyase/cysteine desulfurase